MIEQEMGQSALDTVKKAAAAGADAAAIAGQLLTELRKHMKLRRGMGELSLEALQKSLDRKNRESLAFTSIAADVYQDMRATGILDNGGLRNYSVIAAKNSDQVMIFYGSKDQGRMDQVLSAMDAMYGSKSDLEKDAFFQIARGRNLYVLQDISSEEAELFRHYCDRPDENGSYPRRMPYSIVELNGHRCLLCLESDTDLMRRNMQLVAATMTSEQGGRILEEIRFLLKERQERRIAIEQAVREHLILDADHPSCKVEVTAHDFNYYKNSKLVDTVPRSDKAQAGRIYDIVDGMSSPVVVPKDAFEKLPSSGQQEYLHSPAAAPIQKAYDRQLEINMDQVLAKLNEANELREYLNHMTGFNVKVEGDEIADVIKAFEKEQKKRGKQERQKTSGTEPAAR